MKMIYRDGKGFALVDVMLSVVMMAIVVTCVMQSMTSSLRAMERADAQEMTYMTLENLLTRYQNGEMSDQDDCRVNSDAQLYQCVFQADVGGVPRETVLSIWLKPLK